MDQFEHMSKWKNSYKNFLGEDFWANFQDILVDNGPKVNIYESGNEILCLVALPGLKKMKDINVYAYEKVIEVRGSINFEYDGYRLIQEELFQGNFKRTIELPFPVRDDKIEASYHRGILMINLHRLIPSGETKKKISIQNLDENE